MKNIYDRILTLFSDVFEETHKNLRLKLESGMKSQNSIQFFTCSHNPPLCDPDLCHFILMGLRDIMDNMMDERRYSKDLMRMDDITFYVISKLWWVWMGKRDISQAKTFHKIAISS